MSDTANTFTNIKAMLKDKYGMSKCKKCKDKCKCRK